MNLTPEEALLREFMLYYNADELELFIHDYLEEQADESAERMTHILGNRAVKVAMLMREMAADSQHPFLWTINNETQYDWVFFPGAWEKFQILAQRMSDGIMKILNESSGENNTDKAASTQNESLPTPTMDNTQSNQ